MTEENGEAKINGGGGNGGRNGGVIAVSWRGENGVASGGSARNGRRNGVANGDVIGCGIGGRGVAMAAAYNGGAHRRKLAHRRETMKEENGVSGGGGISQYRHLAEMA